MITGPRWLERRRIHRRAALLLTGLSGLAVVVLGEPSFKVQLILASGAILLLGVPHGAFDAVVAARAPKWSRTRVGTKTFLLSYSALAAAMVGLWLLSPTIGLLVFVVLSWLHFGRGDRVCAAGSQWEPLEVFVRGGLPLLLPIAFHRSEVALLFGWLTALPESQIQRGFAVLLPIVLTLWGIGAVALVALQWKGTAPGGDWRWAQAELLALVLTFVVLPPLLGFAVYFGIWHSARHLIALDALLLDADSSRKRILARGAPILAITLLLMAAGYSILAGQRFEAQALVQVLFVSLAALTVPHIVVTLEVDRGLLREE